MEDLFQYLKFNTVPNNNSVYTPIIVPVNQNSIQVQHQHNIKIESVPVDSKKNTHSSNIKKRANNRVKRERHQEHYERNNDDLCSDDDACCMLLCCLCLILQAFGGR